MILYAPNQWAEREKPSVKATGYDSNRHVSSCFLLLSILPRRYFQLLWTKITVILVTPEFIFEVQIFLLSSNLTNCPHGYLHKDVSNLYSPKQKSCISPQLTFLLCSSSFSSLATSLSCQLLMSKYLPFSSLTCLDPIDFISKRFLNYTHFPESPLPSQRRRYYHL